MLGFDPKGFDVTRVQVSQHMRVETKSVEPIAAPVGLRMLQSGEPLPHMPADPLVKRQAAVFAQPGEGTERIGYQLDVLKMQYRAGSPGGVHHEIGALDPRAADLLTELESVHGAHERSPQHLGQSCY